MKLEHLFNPKEEGFFDYIFWLFILSWLKFESEKKENQI